jgi:uncharacterized cupredoxin-like copper-binding protein
MKWDCGSALIAVLALAVGGCGSEKSSATPSKSSDSPEAQSDTTPSPTSGSQVTGTRTTVSMSEFEFGPRALSAKAGKLRVAAVNHGKSPHEFVLIRTAKAPDALPTKGAEASEAGAVGEIPEQEPGHRATHVFTLEPGRYVYICNVPGHYKAGMAGTLTVK